MNFRVPEQHYDATVFSAVVRFAFGVVITGMAPFVRAPIHSRR
jgi:hypothetical protein